MCRGGVGECKRLDPCNVGARGGFLGDRRLPPPGEITRCDPPGDNIEAVEITPSGADMAPSGDGDSGVSPFSVVVEV